MSFAGSALGYIGKKVLDLALASYLKDDLGKALQQEAADWAKQLPENIECISPETLVSPKLEDSEVTAETRPKLYAVRQKLLDNHVPAASEWCDAILEQIADVRGRLGQDAQALFLADTATVRPFVEDLAERLTHVCKLDESTSRVTTLDAVTDVREDVRLLGAAMDARLAEVLEQITAQRPDARNLIAEQMEAAQSIKWIGLTQFKLPSAIGRKTIFSERRLAQLCALFMHKTYYNHESTSFVGIYDYEQGLDGKHSDKFLHVITAHRREFIQTAKAAVEGFVKQLIDGDSPENIIAKLFADVPAIQQDAWNVSATLLRTPRCPIEFGIHPILRRIDLASVDIAGGPRRFELRRIKTTSDLLMFLGSAGWRQQRAFIELDLDPLNLPTDLKLLKLVAHLSVHPVVDLAYVRVNEANPEQWDLESPIRSD
jgi:hypothetical protein